MRRSNRQVKRKKYTEDLDIKITDDEDEPDEEVDVMTPAPPIAGHSQAAGLELQELDGDGLPSLQFFVVTFILHFIFHHRGHSYSQTLIALKLSFTSFCLKVHLNCCCAVYSFWDHFSLPHSILMKEMFACCVIQENPSEEDAAIVDKVLAMRLTKKEASGR